MIAEKKNDINVMVPLWKSGIKLDLQFKYDNGELDSQSRLLNMLNKNVTFAEEMKEVIEK